MRERERFVHDALFFRVLTPGKRVIVRADEKLTAFLELESAIRACGELV